MCSGAADGVSFAGSFAPPLPALAIPEEGRGLPVPGTRGLLEPGADLGGALRVLAVEGASLQDTLNGPAMLSQLPPSGV